MIDLDEIIVHEDDSIVVVNKPSGLRTIQDGYDKNLPNLQSLLRTRFANLFTVHRLDKETSGLVIFALKKDVHKNLNSQFEQRKVHKLYFAITHNIPDWDEYSAMFHLLINGDRKHRTISTNKGKKSQTDFKKVEINQEKNVSLIKAFPKTGYTHQIRAHLSYLGFPIVGDGLYTDGVSSNKKTMAKNSIRMMLHASSITFIHPESDEEITIDSPIPFNIFEI